MERIDTLDWTRAACAGGDARQLHLFFSENPVEIEEAKALCLRCPLRLECLRGALDRREPWGVWGGQLFDDGQVIATKRGRGRPRKADIERQRRLQLEIEELIEGLRPVEVA